MIGHNGQPVYHCGLVERGAKGTSTNGDDSNSPQEEKDDVSAALLQDLTTQRTAALRAAQREYHLYGTKMYLASGARLTQHKSCTGAECPTPTHAINGNHRPNDSATTQSHHLCTAQTVPRTKQIACCLSLRLRSPSHFSCSLQ